MKITISEQPNFGHSTTAVHEFVINEGLQTITYDRYEHKLIVEFNSCRDKMVVIVGHLRQIKIED